MSIKILYAFQGTGNGHVARARDLVPRLSNYAEVDVLVAGTQSDLNLDFPLIPLIDLLWSMIRKVR